MLDKNYMKVYAMFMIHNTGFSSYKEDGKFIINAKGDKIVITEKECMVNDIVYENADDLVKAYRF